MVFLYKYGMSPGPECQQISSLSSHGMKYSFLKWIWVRKHWCNACVVIKLDTSKNINTAWSLRSASYLNPTTTRPPRGCLKTPAAVSISKAWEEKTKLQGEKRQFIHLSRLPTHPVLLKESPSEILTKPRIWQMISLKAGPRTMHCRQRSDYSGFQRFWQSTAERWTAELKSSGRTGRMEDRLGRY